MDLASIRISTSKRIFNDNLVNDEIFNLLSFRIFKLRIVKKKKKNYPNELIVITIKSA